MRSFRTSVNQPGQGTAISGESNFATRVPRRSGAATLNLEQILEDQSYDVLSASHGEESWRSHRAWWFDEKLNSIEGPLIQRR